MISLNLFEFDGSAGFLKFGSDFVGSVLGHAFLNVGGSAFDESLSVAKTETGDFTDSLDDGDLVAADLFQYDGEFGLLFSSRSSLACARSGSGASVYYAKSKRASYMGRGGAKFRTWSGPGGSSHKGPLTSALAYSGYLFFKRAF